MNAAKYTDHNLLLPPEIAECFQDLPERIALLEGSETNRLRTNRQDLTGNAIWERPWCFPKVTLVQIVGRAGRTGKSVTVAARSGLAVTREFNPDFDTLVNMTLQRSGWTWAGPAAPQKWSETFQVQLSGGFEQWLIPGLEQIDLRYKYFGSVG